MVFSGKSLLHDRTILVSGDSVQQVMDYNDK